MKAISIVNPIAYLVACGAKTVENRSWTTDYRGKLLIHSSGTNTNTITGSDLPLGYANILDVIFNPKVKKRDDVVIGVEETIRRVAFSYYDLSSYEEWIEFDEPARDLPFKSSAIIGEVILQHIKRDADSPWAMRNCYNWILTDAVLYDRPIVGIRGRLGLWDYSDQKGDIPWQKAEAGARRERKPRRARKGSSEGADLA
jgi:hypothetical protein